MEETLVFIEENQTWIYILLAVAGLITFRVTLLRFNAVQNTYFNLEREKARITYIRSALMLVLIIVGLLTTFFVATFAGPSVPISARPTAMPTVSLLSTPYATYAAGAGIFAGPESERLYVFGHLPGAGKAIGGTVPGQPGFSQPKPRPGARG